MAPDAEVGTWVDARYGALLRVAHLLCGDLPEAAARVDDALAVLLSRGGAAGDDRESAVLDVLHGALLQPPAVAVRERPWVRPATPTASLEEEAHLRATWEYLAALPRPARAMLVLTLHSGLDERSAAGALGLPRAEGHDSLAQAVSDVPARPDGRAPGPWLELGLRLCAEATPMVAPDHDLIRSRSAEVGSDRRRRMLMVLGGLVVLLLGGSLVAWALDPGRSTTSGSGFGPTDAPSRAAVGNDGEHQLNGVSLGSRAEVGWSWGTTYVPPGGDPIEMALPEGTRVKSITPFRSGALVLENDGVNDALYLDLIAPDGSLVWRRLAAPRVVTGDSGNSVAYALYDQATGAYRLTLADAGSNERPERTWLYDQDVLPIGILGDEVVFTRPQRIYGVWVTGDRRPARLDSLTIGLTACSAEGLVGGVSSRSQGGLVEAASDRARWQTPTWVPRSISPDCQHVLAVNRDGTGWGLLDAATGDLVIRLDLIWHAPTVNAVFEDDDHVLLVIRAGQSQALVRFDPETRQIERASDVLPTGSRILLPDQ